MYHLPISAVLILFFFLATQKAEGYGFNVGAFWRQPDPAPSSVAIEGYATYTSQGNFDIGLDELLGANHKFSNFDFSKQKFKVNVDVRMLSAIQYGGVAGYSANEVLTQQDKNSYSRLSVTRLLADRAPGSGCNTEVSNSVFDTGRIDGALLSSSPMFDLRNITFWPYSPLKEQYIFKFEQRDKYAVAGNCTPSVHSNRSTGFARVVTSPVAAGVCPSVYCGDGYSNTYGHGFYVYVNSEGKLRMKYSTQNGNTRVAFAIGVAGDPSSPKIPPAVARNKIREAYFVLSRAGNFSLTLDDILGPNNKFSGFDFRHQKFRIYMDVRLLSAIQYGGIAGYTDADIHFNQDHNTFAEVVNIDRRTADWPVGNSLGCTEVPDSVFGPVRVDFDQVAQQPFFIDLSDERLYSLDDMIFDWQAPLYRYEQRDRDGSFASTCQPSVHSSRSAAFAQKVEWDASSCESPYCGDGYSNTYGNGAYIEYSSIDYTANYNLRFVYRTQNNNSRVVMTVGIHGVDP